MRTVDDIKFFNTPLEPERAELLDAARARKLRAGRASKHTGDLCLLAAAPRDAVYHLRTAVEQCASGLGTIPVPAGLNAASQRHQR